MNTVSELHAKVKGKTFALTLWLLLNQSPVNMEKSPAGGGKGTGILGRLEILMAPNPPAALWNPSDGK